MTGASDRDPATRPGRHSLGELTAADIGRHIVVDPDGTRTPAGTITATATRTTIVRTFTLTGAPEVSVKYASVKMQPERLDIETRDGTITTLTLYGHGPGPSKADPPLRLEVHYGHEIARPPAWLDALAAQLTP